MEILVNGKKEKIKKSVSIGELLKIKNIRREVVTVYLNEKLIDRENYDTTLLRDGDELEFIFYMGGGNCNA
jgi:sulfur carrier protein